MIFKKISELKFFVFVSFLAHFLFFNQIYLNDTSLIYSGRDSIRLHLASKFFLNDSLGQGVFPIFTDKMFGNYPIFFDLERGYQNIFNILFVYLLGPFETHNLLLFVTYFIGSISLFVLLGKIQKGDFLTKSILSLLYFYSFNVIYHLQHQNIIYCVYILPTIVLFSLNYINTKKISNIIILSVIYYFLVTFGSLQAVFINFVFQILFVSFYIENFKRILKFTVILFLTQFILTFPSLYYFFQLYLDSVRESGFVPLQGNLSIFHLWTTFFPFILGSENFLGQMLNPDYLKHEFILYFSTSLLVSIFFVFGNDEKSKFKNIFIYAIVFFLISNLINLFPFDLFRYWVRGVYIINLASILLIYEFLNRNISFKINSKTLLYAFLFSIVLSFSLADSKFTFLAFRSIEQNLGNLIFAIMVILLATLTLVYKKKVFLFILVFEALFFLNRFDFNLYISIDEIISYTNQENIFIDTKDDYSLFKQGPSLSGYSQLKPKDAPNLLSDKYDLNDYLIMLGFFGLLYFLILFIIKKDEFTKKL